MTRKARSNDGEFRPPPRILMLVPHEPDEDPRIKWVGALCAEVARTDVFGAVYRNDKPARTYDGRTYLERVPIAELASGGSKLAARIGGRLGAARLVRRYTRRMSERLEADGERARPNRLGLFGELEHQCAAATRFVSNWMCYAGIISALDRRARAVSVPPRVVVCHDIFSLPAALRLKRTFGSRVLYDSHEHWPDADLLSQPWETRAIAALERRWIREADTVVTVTPQLARRLQSFYRLENVLSVPNAEPLAAGARRAVDRPIGRKVRFILQGRVCPGRGLERFMFHWCKLARSDAILYVRAMPSPYLDHLRTRFAGAIADRRVKFLPPVKEDELVSGASIADVGVIPYDGETLNHRYCCPNKLSQYMQAGLALLANRLEFVSEIVARYDCGLTYDAGDPGSLASAVDVLVGDRGRLKAFQHNAYRGSRRDFHWDSVAVEYKNRLESYCYPVEEDGKDRSEFLRRSA